MEHGRFVFSVFTFDIGSGELMRNGRKLRIPRQTSNLLAIFVQRAGKLVTREELQQHLWPEGETVEYRPAINRAVNQLRMVLRDDSQNPRYIETVYKYGYRFLPEVTLIPAEPQEQSNKFEQEEQPAPEALETALTFTGEEQSATQFSVPPSVLVVPQQEIVFKEVISEYFPSAPVRPRRWLMPAVLTTLVVLVAAVVSLIYLHIRHSEVRAQERTSHVVSLGIAPFETEGDNAAELAESLRLDLMDSLSQLPAVQLKAAHSLENIKLDDANIRSVAATLHLDYLLLGKLTLHGDNCQFQFELIRGQDAVHMASYQFTGTRSELASIRNRLQQSIFDTLHGPGTSVQILRGSTQDPEAYADYLQARNLSRQRKINAIKDAITLYQRAINRDPNFAQAYAGMATAELRASNLVEFKELSERQNQARQLARKALALNSGLAEAHAVLGLITFRRDWNYTEGENELRHAVDLEPSEATYHVWLAEVLTVKGNTAEALHEIDTAAAADPLWQGVYGGEVFVAGLVGEHKREIAAARKALQAAPTPYSHDQLAWALFAQKHYDEASREWLAMAAMEHDTERMELENQSLAALKHGGIAEYADLRLKAIAEHSPVVERHPNDFVAAEWYAFTGNDNRALTEIDKLIAAHDDEALGLAGNPMFDNLHHEPRFLAQLSRVGLRLH